MNKEQFERIKNGKGFIVALDQSGGSTPKVLKLYGIPEESYSSEEEMFDLIHQMRARIIKSPAFRSEYILGAILFQNTMEREIDGYFTADYLWKVKGIVPFLKVDVGLEKEENGVQRMKPIPHLEETLKRAKERNIFGTKMRSFIKRANPEGIRDIVAQQFEVARQIIAAGFLPILEPEVDIYSPDKEKTEEILKEEIIKHLSSLGSEEKIMLKVSIPSKDDFYFDLMDDPHIVRIVALSGGYSRKEANERLSRNHGLIASFSRALMEGLTAQQSEEEFNDTLSASIQSIYEASIT